MKTRENELHEPKIKKKGNEIIAYCALCNEKLEDIYNCTDDDDTEVLDMYSPNYCPNCGARLKEVGE